MTFRPLLALLMLSSLVAAQEMTDSALVAGLKFRSLGPALTSGRISDFAVHPSSNKIYYVATSSGGVWKTENAGTTFKPVFDSQGSYSIGCVTLDPNNPSLVWVGTGENNNQRSVAYGDGIYKSEDGGVTWKNMGLRDSEHIAKIIVDPRNSQVVYVAAIGPLWRSGGERGVYKTEDGGKNWKPVLTIDEHTGVTDLVMDPRDPNVLYAAAHQRARHVFTYVGGGPGSGIHKSTDGGKSWQKVNKGLPAVDLGRIGLAIAESDPEVLYAIVEASEGKSGFYRSLNRGASWHKQSDYVTSGNYYQEIVVDPKDALKIYAMDTWMHMSNDGGKTFKKVPETFKHVDNHCHWIDPQDTGHMLSGCDGGIYETWDHGATWQFKANLPVIQFYKVSVDNDLPFYNIYGGTQDNFSLGGPSRSISGQGIINSDWYITHGGDGFETQIDPNDPNIVYSQSQYGGLVRYDRKNGEEKGIQPQERQGEKEYRWNWDAPLAISHHKPERLYFAANKLFRSEDRGDSWKVISDDLTTQTDRNKLTIMGRVWSVDAVAKNQSTSPYGTIVAFSESPFDEKVLYVGTDDGLIQVSVDGGQTWTRIAKIKGVPQGTYVNALWASQHDASTVYACFNRHKYGDFKPYVFKSTDRGSTWRSVTGDLPGRGSTYAFAEDHIDNQLLFVGTEFGVFFSRSGGAKWTQLRNGVPTIAVRDIAIQKRENDLVLGTFGRGFFVLDDYSVLRNLKEDKVGSQGALFAVRDALVFEYSYPLGLPGKSFQGDAFFTADNLGSEAILTYYVKDKIQTREEIRRAAEKESLKSNKSLSYPTYENYRLESEEQTPYLLLTITSESGQVVRKLKAAPAVGIQRVKWDLRYTAKYAIDISSPGSYNPFASRDEGTLVEPGKYTVKLSKVVDGISTELAAPLEFSVVPLENGTLQSVDRKSLVEFQRQVNELLRRVDGTQKHIGELKTRLKYISTAIHSVDEPHQEWSSNLRALHKTLDDIESRLTRDKVAADLDIEKPPTVANRLGWIVYEQYYSTAKPTQTHKDSYAIAASEYKDILSLVQNLASEIQAFQLRLQKAGAPYTPGTLPAD